MSETIPVERAKGIQFFLSDEALTRCSWYRLYPEERYLFQKYYRPGDKVLDHACGAGRTTLLLHEMGYDVQGFDLSERLIEVARRRFPYLRLSVGDYCSVDTPSESWDHVLISFNGIDSSFPEEQRIQALREAHRVLRTGGTFIFSSHNIRGLLTAPYRLRHPIWRLKSFIHGFRAKAYLSELGAETLFYGSSAYVIRQTESIGFRFEEMIGLRMLRHPILANYGAPYIYYAFRKR